MIGTITLLAGASVAAVMVTGARVVGLRTMVKHSTKLDVGFTALAGFALAGTITGLATAIVAGLMMALVLSVLKWVYGTVDAVQRGCGAVRAEYQERKQHNDNPIRFEGPCELWVRGEYKGMVA